MEMIYQRPESMKNRVTGYCPGCLHGVTSRIVAELIDELGVREKTVCVLPVGCSTMGFFTFNFDMISPAHGRAPAVATAVKRCSPDSFVFTYQGDGDLAAIGLSEIMHCANRGENITTIFVNNNIYGMTGGQMAPTTLIGQKSSTTVTGRTVEGNGFPMKMCEIVAQLKAPVYIARFALDTPQNIVKAKQGLKKAFQIQLAGQGYSFVELLSNCPTNWGMSPLDSLEWMRKNTIPEFPLGEFRIPERSGRDGK